MYLELHSDVSCVQVLALGLLAGASLGVRFLSLGAAARRKPFPVN